jgi:hypothetical protein
MSNTSRAEYNLWTAVRFGPPYTLQVYGQDVVDILAEVDQLRAAAVAALDAGELASVQALPANVQAADRG